MALTTKSVIANVAVVAPASTVTDVGTVAAAVDELVSDTTAPPDAAFPAESYSSGDR